MILLSCHLLFLMFSLILLIFRQEGSSVVALAIIFAAIELSLWAIRQRRLASLNWCHPVPVFVLGYCIVYYQLAFCYFFDFKLSYYSQYVLFSPGNVSYCVLLATLGLASFFCGEQIIHLRKNNLANIPRYGLDLSDKKISNYFIRIKNVNSAILLLTIIFFTLYIRSMGFSSYFGFSYGESFRTASSFSSHFAFAYTILLYLSILLELSRIILVRPKSVLDYVCVWDIRVLVVISITLVPFLLSGDRGSYLQPLSLIFAPYFIFVKPLSFKKALLLIIVGAFILVLVGDTRSGRAVTWGEAFNSRIESISNPAEWPTMELANSFGTFNIATVYFPGRYPYNSGLNILYRLSSLIPFTSFFTEIEKKNKEHDYIFSSSLFFTNVLTRGTFSSGSGTSSLADVYIDFGPYGIPFVLFLWGLFMGWVCHGGTKAFSSILVFLYSYYSYYGIYVNRSSFFFGWNNFVWAILFFIIIDKLYLTGYSNKNYSL